VYWYSSGCVSMGGGAGMVSVLVWSYLSLSSVYLGVHCKGVIYANWLLKKFSKNDRDSGRQLP